MLAPQETGEFIAGDILNVGRTDPGLHDRGGVDVHLERRLLAAQNVALEVRGDVEDEGVAPFVHARIELRQIDLYRGLERRREEGPTDALRENRAVFVDDGDGGVAQLRTDARGPIVDAEGEGVEDQREEHGVAAQAKELLDAEPENVAEPLHVQGSCFFKSSRLAKVSSGMKPARTR